MQAQEEDLVLQSTQQKAVNLTVCYITSIHNQQSTKEHMRLQHTFGIACSKHTEASGNNLFENKVCPIPIKATCRSGFFSIAVL